MKRLMLILAMVIFLMAGCSTYSTHRYSISVDNIMALKTHSEAKINVGQFSATKPGLTQILCRGVGPIQTPDGQTFEDYIRKALVDELKISELYSDSASIIFTGNLDLIDFDSNLGTWSLAVTIKSSNGKSVTISHIHSYTTSFYGETACNQTAQAFMPAVQDLIGKIIQHPKFVLLIE